MYMHTVSINKTFCLSIVDEISIATHLFSNFIVGNRTSDGHGKSNQLELMFMKHYAPNRCLYIKVAKLRTGVGSAEMSHLQNRCLKISG